MTIKVYGGANGGGKSHFQAHALQELKEFMESQLLNIDFVVFDDEGWKNVPNTDALRNLGVDRVWLPKHNTPT